MTFILAKSCDEESIKEALKERRTIGYSGNHLVGEERYLAAFIDAAVECKVVAEDDKKLTYSLTNRCSVPFMLFHQNNTYKLEPFRALCFSFSKDTPPTFVVENMWHVDEQHPTVTLSIDK